MPQMPRGGRPGLLDHRGQRGRRGGGAAAAAGCLGGGPAGGPSLQEEVGVPGLYYLPLRKDHDLCVHNRGAMNDSDISWFDAPRS